MSKLPTEIRRRLRRESHEWDASIAKESEQELQDLLEQSEVWEASRPPRKPVSLRMDPFDLAMLKRMARKKGIAYTQLMAMWLHERIEQERNSSGD